MSRIVYSFWNWASKFWTNDQVGCTTLTFRGKVTIIQSFKFPQYMRDNLKNDVFFYSLWPSGERWPSIEQVARLHFLWNRPCYYSYFLVYKNSFIGLYLSLFHFNWHLLWNWPCYYSGWEKVISTVSLVFTFHNIRRRKNGGGFICLCIC